MASPSSATGRYSKNYLGLGPTLRLHVNDDNTAENSLTDAQKTPPFCRFAPTLSMFFRTEGRTLDAGNSFTQGGGGVSSYSWSGGGSGSTKVYTINTAGLSTVTCTVTDTNGVTTQGTRWIICRERPGVGPAGDQAITSFRFGAIRGTIGERGWSGYSVDVEVLDPSLVNEFTLNRMVVIYAEEYERTGGGAYSLFASGEKFVGVITSPRLVIDPEKNTFTFTAQTIEAAFASRLGHTLDGDDHVFVDRLLYEANEVSDPMAGGGLAAPVSGATPGANALNVKDAHQIPSLTLGKILSHLLNFHVEVDMNGTRYRFPEVVDLVSDWWNLLAGSTPTIVTYANIPRGGIRNAIENCLPEGLWLMYCDKEGRVNLTAHHAAKQSADSNVDSITQALVYELEPIDGDSDVVRQVKLLQAAQAKSDLTTEGLVAVFPGSPDATGSLLQPSWPYWFTTQADGDALAEALYKHANANARVRVRLAGTTFGLFNRFTITITGFSSYGWTNKAFWVESDNITSDTEWMGGLVQEIVGREIP